MSCEVHRDQVLLHAVGALDRSESESLLAHIDAGCPACAGALAESLALVAHLPLALPAMEPSPFVRSRLMQRIVATRPTAPSSTAPSIPAVVPAPSPSRSVLGEPTGSGLRRWIAPALAAGLAAAVVHVGAVRPALRDSRRLELALNEQRGEVQRLLESQAVTFEAQLETQRRQIERLEMEAGRAAQTASLLQASQLLMVELRGGATQPEAQGRILWNRDRGIWHLYASGLQPAGEGRTYELWFITAADEKIPAGTFDVDAEGRATLYVEVPKGIGTIAVAAVTDEPAGGVPQPTGSVQLAGAVPEVG